MLCLQALMARGIQSVAGLRHQFSKDPLAVATCAG